MPNVLVDALEEHHGGPLQPEQLRQWFRTGADRAAEALDVPSTMITDAAFYTPIQGALHHLEPRREHDEACRGVFAALLRREPLSAAAIIHHSPHAARAHILGGGYTALQQAIYHSTEGTLALIRAITTAFPQSVRIPDPEGRVPVHLALRQASRHSETRIVVQELLNLWPEPTIVFDMVRQSLKRALLEQDLSLATSILAESPEVVVLLDAAGYLPVHWSLVYATHGTAGLVARMISHYPEAVAVRDGSGFTPLDIARTKQFEGREDVILQMEMILAQLDERGRDADDEDWGLFVPRDWLTRYKPLAKRNECPLPDGVDPLLGAVLRGASSMRRRSWAPLGGMKGARARGETPSPLGDDFVYEMDTPTLDKEVVVLAKLGDGPRIAMREASSESLIEMGGRW